MTLSTNYTVMQFIFDNSVSISHEPYSLNWYKCVVFVAKWHVTLPVFRHCIKVIIYNNIFCFYLQTPETYPKLHIIKFA